MTPEGISELISRVALRDRAAFDILYASTSAKLFGVCLRVLGNRTEAEDALQDIYVKIWNKADRFAVADTSPISWLVAIARNHCIDLLRSRKPAAVELNAAAAISEPSPDPEQLAVAGGEARRIYDCLGQLDVDRAAAVRGAYLNGDSYEALASRYKVPLNTMRTWLRRSLIKLKECLEG
ncbi:sigma-70 family RNA polymerase sigma factor [Phyllobacterium endophyticum]|jgi:RNA polymerase sigma-70 factor (ECF subfamily)|uniref:RNA polymerase subunit sigma n=1 Tax=Phyllobacterium endophyticum TaxID=1149773 RepID=A0A2P7B0C5_9HYPH|nr:sigma-70 family RNA polymerase sigma factor [Phyllobacterium endophyticum]PSH59901.1 RNA polymerase subunit sigma [Phyllobacterium endophyticum]TXR50060.1 sigma-70 family RNA polymerase sigma factor [Phyllobacterium endophyticum]TYR42054.1 sigma-70 family RNA polymerase sigma factor [Phyllobacterium endophyticum]